MMYSPQDLASTTAVVEDAIAICLKFLLSPSYLPDDRVRTFASWLLQHFVLHQTVLYICNCWLLMAR